MRIREAGQSRDGFVDFRIVFHRARAERIEPVVHAVSALGERGVMAHDLGLRKFGQNEFVAQMVSIVIVSFDFERRHFRTASSFDGLFENCQHKTSFTTDTTSSISALAFFSVQHQSMRCLSSTSPPRMPLFSSAALIAAALPGVTVTNSLKNSPS